MPPTDLPEDFKGTGKPDSWVETDPERERKAEAASKLSVPEILAVIFIVVPVVASFVFAVVGALCYLGMWFFANMR